MLYISSDHGGFELKTDVDRFLKSKKIKFEDLGPSVYSPEDDYPKAAAALAAKVSSNPKENKGILICRSGHGVSIVANKFKGVRAALCWNEQVAKASRNDDDANVICLPSDYLSPETATRTLKIWLDTPFSTDPKYARRIEEIKIIESKQ
jgi:ribose 5-phosphate isomerase B